MRNVVLFVHVLAALALFGPVFLLPSISATFKGKPVNPVITIISIIERQALQFVPVQLVTGIWLVSLSDAGWSAWVIISLVLTMAMGLLAALVDRPRMAAVLEAVGSGNDLKAIEHLRVPMKITAPLLMICALVVLFLMVAKPGA